MINFIKKIPGFLMTFLLIIVYTFFFLLSRGVFEKFILKTVSEEKRDRAKAIIISSGNIAKQYLLGRFILIVFLAVIYFIGFSLIGLDYALVISSLAAALSLVPYLGNAFGVVLAIGVGLMTGKGSSGIVWILIIFFVAQFMESYVLQPFMVGAKVNINPVMTIIVLALGGAVWGMAGMVLAIPVTGIVKVVCDNIPQLNAFGYLLGQEQASPDGIDRLKKKVSGWFGK